MSILAGNLNSRRSYLITAVLVFTVLESSYTGKNFQHCKKRIDNYYSNRIFFKLQTHTILLGNRIINGHTKLETSRKIKKKNHPDLSILQRSNRK